jgi:TrmH family RNA methyltransferase
VLAADGYGSTDLDECIEDGTLAKPTVWLFGNEAHGLPDGFDAIVDRSVKVPIYGRAESLNLATAAAICLYASARAQRST